MATKTEEAKKEETNDELKKRLIGEDLKFIDPGKQDEWIEFVESSFASKLYSGIAAKLTMDLIKAVNSGDYLNIEKYFRTDDRPQVAITNAVKFSTICRQHERLIRDLGRCPAESQGWGRY